MAVLEIFLVLLFKVVLVVVSLLVIWTTVAALSRVIPDGPVKTFLFRIRDDQESPTPSHERLPVKAAIFAMVAGLILFIAWLSGR